MLFAKYLHQTIVQVILLLICGLNIFYSSCKFKMHQDAVREVVRPAATRVFRKTARIMLPH